MEVRDGFIVGIFNYCDRWCERCRFTSHCRLFADGAETDARSDANMAAVVHAPPRPEDVPPPPPGWRQALIERDESIMAWHALVAAGQVETSIARRFVSELEILTRDLDVAIPGARGFVRPGFDEPGAVAAMLVRGE